MQAAVFGHVKWMSNPDYQQKHRKHWYRVEDVGDDKARDGLTTSKMIYSSVTVTQQQSAECVKDRKQWKKLVHA